MGANKIIPFMEKLEKDGVLVNRLTNTEILIRYYEFLGVTKETTFHSFILQVSQKGIPAYETVTRQIRKAREDLLRWKKNTK